MADNPIELHHGGRLLAAAQQFGIPASQWLDISTGINPHSWPIPPLPASVWQRLPEDEDDLLDAAAAYYGTAAQNILASAGSQAALQALPSLLPLGEVLIPQPSFNEHHKAWRDHGHAMTSCSPTETAIEETLNQTAVRYAVIVNPNNPTGDTYGSAALERWRQLLLARGGLLVVDEAFMDVTPENSCITPEAKPGLVILRSVGKFFGLAGLRLGFVIGPDVVINELRNRLGPWSVSHPARFIGCHALQDTYGPEQMRQRLIEEQHELREVLLAFTNSLDREYLLGGCALFQSLYLPQGSGALFHRLAEQGILTRHFPDSHWLRFGLPGSTAALQRLEKGLKQYLL